MNPQRMDSLKRKTSLSPPSNSLDLLIYPRYYLDSFAAFNIIWDKCKKFRICKGLGIADFLGTSYIVIDVPINIYILNKSSSNLSLQPEKVETSPDDVKSIQNALSLTKEFQVVKITCKKPNYEVGSTSQLKISFGKKKGMKCCCLMF